MTNPQSVAVRIREFVLKTFPPAGKRTLGDDEKWLESGLIESLGILDLIHFLETEFSIEVSDEELLPENFQSLSAAATFVQRKQGAAAFSTAMQNRAV